MTVEIDKVTTGQILISIIWMLIFPTLVLFLSGDWFWVEGWIFDIWFIVLGFSTIIYVYRKDPALLAERFRSPGTGNQKGWDLYFYYVEVIAFFAFFIIMPLDAKRYEWTTDFPLWLKILGGIGLLKSFFFLYRAYTDNTFLSPLVRIQTERKQKVISEGVYGFVRHPMYLGAILLFLGTPMLLSSKYGIVLGILMSLLLVARIFGEEKMLVEELEGYEDYKTKVKYRLIPFVW
ncbi:MAG: isoprenylcysteine carboxylmethyltransferase family protein [Hydrococcus sp. Prado102]|jgi:protein-S-isoprenylcysteine O-methyltransferase Ste14|nr:isoprenylcysteine carboxylmethyltransferase family protein [Hydrococcus sp. Prado102]